MDKWEELRETINELHEGNIDKPDVETVTRFLLNLMGVLDSEAELIWNKPDVEIDDEMASDMRDYCERYEPTYNPEDGSM